MGRSERNQRMSDVNEYHIECIQRGDGHTIHEKSLQMFCEVFSFMSGLFAYLKTTLRSRVSQNNLKVVSRPHLSGTIITIDLHGHTLHRVGNRPHRHEDRNPVLQTTAAHTDAYRKTRRLRRPDMSKWCITVLAHPIPQCNTKKTMLLS